MVLAHRIQLEPTYQQRAYFARACGTSRFVWNHALETWNRLYERGGKPKEQKLRKDFNSTYLISHPWVSETHRDCHSQPFKDLQVSFNNFFKKKAKRPVFKRKDEHDSFYVSNDRLAFDDVRVRLPVIGWVKLTEPLRFVGKVMGARVTRTADRWFMSVQVDIGDAQWERVSDGTVGVDLGVKHAVVTSDNEVFDGPKPLKKSLEKLQRLGRQHSRKQKGSRNKRKLSMRLARLHARIANIRKDWLHKTTTQICRENQTVVIEDLNVKGMVRNHKLARAISDVGFGEFRRQIEYKTKLYGSTLVVADRWFPSSKTCSGCGSVKEKLGLGERVYRCGNCGIEVDRDLNAALNLRQLVTKRTPGLGGSVDFESTKPVE